MNVLFLESEPLYDDLLPAGLRQTGCRVETVTEVLDGHLDRTLSVFQPDFILMMGWSSFPTNERLAVIREAADQRRIPIVFWSTEDPCWHEQWSLPVVQTLEPDLVLTICQEYVSQYEAMGIQADCLPFGYNHELYRSGPSRPEYACDIAVVANFYATEFHRLNRKRSLEELLAPLLDRGYDLKIWGVRWDQAAQFGLTLPAGAWQGWLNHREAPAVYNSAKIVLGLQNEFDFATNLTMRTCEVMGSGGFLLSSRTKAVERMFEHKVHLVMSGSPEKTLELVDYYLGRPDERARIAAAGKARVRLRHTYEQRAMELLSHIERFGLERLVKQHCPSPLPTGPHGPCEIHIHFHFHCDGSECPECSDCSDCPDCPDCQESPGSPECPEHPEHSECPDCPECPERPDCPECSDCPECPDGSGSHSHDSSGSESDDGSGSHSYDSSGSESDDGSGSHSHDSSGSESDDGSGSHSHDSSGSESDDGSGSRSGSESDDSRGSESSSGSAT